MLYQRMQSVSVSVKGWMRRDVLLRRGLALLLFIGVSLPLILVIGFEPHRKPPRALWFEGVPVRGSMADAQRAGFTDCIRFTRSVRCQREGVMIAGEGPYSAGVDLLYRDGSGGFDEVVLWSDDDQKAVSRVGRVAKDRGWSLCRTGPTEFRGDQEIYRSARSPVRLSIDISYWNKRRLRMIPEQDQPTGHCWST
jgi:hypothetical protein